MIWKRDARAVEKMCSTLTVQNTLCIMNLDFPNRKFLSEKEKKIGKDF